VGIDDAGARGERKCDEGAHDRVAACVIAIGDQRWAAEAAPTTESYAGRDRVADHAQFLEEGRRADLGEFAGLHAVVRRSYEEASAALGYDLWQLTASGPAEQLNKTECTQPAMLVAGVATWRLWQEQGGRRPEWMAGHSLGEFTALVCCGALDFAATVKLVRERGRLMQAAVPEGEGAMAAILGLDEPAAEAACADGAQGGVVEAGNYNAPGQIVIAGQRRAVGRYSGQERSTWMEVEFAWPLAWS